MPNTRQGEIEMKTFTIKDLPVTETLDRRAMSAVRGGNALFAPGFLSGFDLSKISTIFTPQQFIGQTQTTLTENGSNIAFADGLTARERGAEAGSQQHRQPQLRCGARSGLTASMVARNALRREAVTHQCSLAAKAGHGELCRNTAR